MKGRAARGSGHSTRSTFQLKDLHAHCPKNRGGSTGQSKEEAFERQSGHVLAWRAAPGALPSPPSLANICSIGQRPSEGSFLPPNITSKSQTSHVKINSMMLLALQEKFFWLKKKNKSERARNETICPKEGLFRATWLCGPPISHL